jgi:hypothetical protein
LIGETLIEVALNDVFAKPCYPSHVKIGGVKIEWFVPSYAVIFQSRGNQQQGPKEQTDGNPPMH